MAKGQIMVSVTINKKPLQIPISEELNDILEETTGLGKTRAEKGRSLILIALAHLGYLDKKSTQKIIEAIK